MVASAGELIELFNQYNVLQTFIHNIEAILGTPAQTPDLQAGLNILQQDHNIIQQKLDNILQQERLIWADLSRQIQALAGQTGVPQQATQAVVLPDMPPAGYGGPPASDVANAVWTYLGPGWLINSGDYLNNIGPAVINLSAANVGFPTPDNPGWWVFGPWNSLTGPDLPGRDIPDADPSTILATDATIAAWLNRAYPGFGVTLTPSDYAFVAGSSGFNYVYDMSPWEFELVKANQPPGEFGGAVAPIWPGIARVTLGTPVALVDGLSISAAMDGVIVHVDEPPTSVQRIPYGPVESFGHIGALSFSNDDSQQEFFQILGFEDQVYVPSTMARASGVVFRVRAGVTGTVTPWTKA